jgi:hypothetical protein
MSSALKVVIPIEGSPAMLELRAGDAGSALGKVTLHLPARQVEETEEPSALKGIWTRFNELYQAVEETPLYSARWTLIKMVSKIADWVESLLEELKELHNLDSPLGEAMVDGVKKGVCVAALFKPLTFGFDLYSCVKKWQAADTPLHRLTAATSSIKVVNTIIQLALGIISAAGKFSAEVKNRVVPTMEFFAFKTISLGLGAIAGGLTLFERCATAQKTVDYVDAFFRGALLMETLCKLPVSIAEKLLAAMPALDTSVQLASWGPCLTAVGLIFSTASLGAAGCSLWRTHAFERKVQRHVDRELLSNLVDKYGCGQQAILPADLSRRATVVQRQLLIRGALKELETLSQGGGEKEAIHDKVQALQTVLKDIEQAGDAGSGTVARMRLKLPADLAQAIADPTLRSSLQDFTRLELQQLKGINLNTKVAELLAEIQDSLANENPPLQPLLNQVAQIAYIDTLRKLPPSRLSVHFNCSKAELVERLDRVSKCYHESRCDALACKLLDHTVTALKGRIKEAKQSDYWLITSNVVSIVAGTLLTVIAFGVTCSPLAPIAYGLLALVAASVVAKLLYNHFSKVRFEEQIGITEERYRQDWRRRLGELSPPLCTEELAVAITIERQIAAGQFDSYEPLPLELLQRRQRQAQIDKREIEVRQLGQRLRSIKMLNRIRKEVSAWGVKRQPLGYVISVL